MPLPEAQIKILNIMNTPLMTTADVTASCDRSTASSGTTADGTNELTKAAVQRQKCTISTNVWAAYDAAVVKQTFEDTFIGAGCYRGSPEMKPGVTTPPGIKQCQTNTATDKVKAFFGLVGASGQSVDVLKLAEGGARVMVSGPGSSAESNGDPHIHRADGHKADFRGEDGKIFNMLSARNFSLGVRTVESHFMQKYGAQKVHGSHFADAFFTMRTNETGIVVTARLSATVTPWSEPETVVAISGSEKYPIHLSYSARKSFAIEDVNITAISAAKVLVRGASWEVLLTRRLLYKPLPESKTKNYLDLVVRRAFKDPKALASHGVIGQSFDPRHGIKQDGKTDDYSASEVTTTAQAEGAIEGTHTDYMLSAPFQTTFKYSLFDAPPEKATDAATEAAFLTEAFSETEDKFE